MQSRAQTASAVALGPRTKRPAEHAGLAGEAPARPMADRAQYWGLKHAGLAVEAPARPMADRAQYWGLKLFVGFLFIGSSLISLTGLFLVVRWVGNL